MTFEEYNKLAARTECDYVKARDRIGGLAEGLSASGSNQDLLIPIRLNHVLLTLQNELGEMAKAFLGWVYYGTKPLDRPNWKEELGDIFWSVALLCNTLGLDPVEVMEANIRKLQVRYPKGFTSQHCDEKNRNVAAEQQAIEISSLASKTKPCPICGGTGQYRPDKGSIKVEVCSTCSGTGDVKR